MAKREPIRARYSVRKRWGQRYQLGCEIAGGAGHAVHRRHGYPAAAVGYVPHRQLNQISGRKEREGYAGDQLGDPASADACPVSYRPVCVTHS